MAHVISDNLYNQLMELDTFDKFLEIRDLIKNSQNVENTSNMQLFSCRCLSANEYNSYIIEGTCKGSITQNDNNVYHHLFEPQYKGLHNYSKPLIYAKGTTISTTISGTITFIFDESELLRVRDFYNNQLYIDDNILSCCCQESVGSSGSMYNSYTGWIECYGEMNSSIYQYSAKKISDTSFCEKNLTTCIVENVQSIRRYETFGGDNPGYKNMCAMYRLNTSTCFRPVFQYIDNDKSNDIFK